MTTRGGFVHTVTKINKSSYLPGAGRRRQRLSALTGAVFAVAPFLFSRMAPAQVAPGVTDTWTGSDASSPNWDNAGNDLLSGSNWTTTNPSGYPANGDTLIFDGPNTASNDDITNLTLDGGITFNATASAFLVTSNVGTNVLLSGDVYTLNSGAALGATNNYGIGVGVQDNNATTAEAESLNLTLDWGTYTIGAVAGGTLALNGTLTAKTGGIAYLGSGQGTITSSTMTLDSTGLISGLSGAGLLYTTASPTDGYNFTGLATVTNGTVTAYNYSTDPHAVTLSAAGAIVNNPTANIQLTNSAAANFTLSGTASGTLTITRVNTIFTNTGTGTSSTSAGFENITIGASQVFVVGAANNTGGFYVTNAGTNTSNEDLFTIDSSGSGATLATLTAGNGTSAAEMVFAVNGAGTSNQLSENAEITNNNTLGNNAAVTVVKTGTGGMVLRPASTYTGGTYVEEGYVQADAVTAYGTGAIYVAAGAAALINASGTCANPIELSPGNGSPLENSGGLKTEATLFTGQITLLGSPVTATMTPTTTGAGDRIGFNTSTKVVFSNQITGPGTLDLFADNGNSTANFANTNNNNNWTGGLQIDNAGADHMDVQMGATNQIPNGIGSGNVTLNETGGIAQFDLNGFNTTINGLNSGPANPTSATNIVANLGGASHNLPATLTLGAGNASGNFGGLIEDDFTTNVAGTLSIVKIGTGTQIISGSNTFMGGTTISTGTVQALNTNALGGGNLTLSGGTLDVDGTNVSVLGNLSGTTGTITNSSTAAAVITIGGTANTNFAGSFQDGALPGGLGLTYQGIGTLNLSGSNTNTGTLTINSANASGTGALLISGSYAGGTTTITSGALIVNSTLGGTVTLGNASPAILAGSGTVNTVMVNGSGSIEAGDPGTAGILNISTSLSVSGGTLLFTPSNTATGELIANSASIAGGSTVDVALARGVNLTAGTYTLLATNTNLGAPTLNFTGPTLTRQSFSLDDASNPDDILLDVGVGTPANLVWIGNQNSGAWDVVTTTNWFNTGTSRVDEFFNQDNVTFNDAGSTTTVNINSTVSPSSTTVSSSKNYTFTGGGSISGIGGLTKSGTGTLVLNTSNSYALGTAIQNGVLQLGNSSAIPSTSPVSFGDSSGDSGALDLNGQSVTISALSVVGGAANVIGSSSSGSQLIYAGSGSNPSTFSGAIVDVLPGATNNGQQTSLTVSTGTLTLTGSNTYSGPTTINGTATLQVGNGGSGSINPATTINDDGTLIFDSAANISVGAINGSGNLQQLGPDTLTLTASNSFNNTIIGTGSTLQVDTGGTVANLGGGSVADNGTLIFDRGDATTVNINTSIAGSGSVVDIGKGEIELSASNGYSGGTTIGSGAVILINSGSSLGSGPVTVENGGTLDLSAAPTDLSFGTQQFYISGNGVATSNFPTGEGAIVNNLPTGVAQDDSVVGGPFSNITLLGNSSIGGTQRWDIRTSGTLDLNGFTLTKIGSNEITIQGITITNGAATTPGFIDVQSGGELGFQTTTSTPGNASAGQINMEVNSLFNVFGETGGLTWQVNLFGNNTFGNGATGNTVPALIPAPILIKGPGVTLEPISSETPSPGQNTPLTLSGNITDNGAGYPLTIFGATQWTLSGSNSWTGGTNLELGTLTLGSSNSLPTGTILTMGAASATGPSVGNTGASESNTAGVLDLGGFNATIGGLQVLGSGAQTIGSSSTAAVVSTLTYAGAGNPVSSFNGTIQDSINGGVGKVALTVTGGSLVLTGNSTYSGGTSITGGTLEVDGALNSVGAVTINSGATLVGAGAVGDIASNGNIVVGNAANPLGTLTANNLVYNAGTLSFDIGATNAGEISTGGATFTAMPTFSFNFAVGLPNSPGTYTILQSNSTIADGGFLGSLGTYSVGRFSVVPEEVNGNQIAAVITGSPGILDWNGAGNGTSWNVQTTSNWLNTGNSQEDLFYNFDNVTFGDNNNGHYNVSIAAGGVTPSAVTVNTAHTYTISGGPIAGFTGVTVNAGTLVLASNNTFTGGITVNGGAVSASSDTQLGAVPASQQSANISLNGGALQANGSFTLNPNRGITLGATGGTLDALPGASLSYAGSITGNSGLTTTPSGGTLVLSGNNSYSGGTTVAAGELTIALTSALPGNTPVVNNGTFNIAPTDAPLNVPSITGAGTTSVGAGFTANIVTINQGSLVNNGYVSVTGTAANTVKNVSGAGTLVIGNGTNSGTLMLTGVNMVSTQASLTINGGSTAGSTLDLGQNAMLIPDGGNPATAEATIQQYVENAQGGPTAIAGGGNIVSSYAANSGLDVAYADASDTNLAGSKLATDNPGDIVIEPALAGDTDLNGTVNIHDLTNLLSDFNSPGFWDQGNFNGHANVDISDLSALLTNFNTSVALTYSELNGIENLASQFGLDAIPNINGNGFTLVSVPEPASVGLIAAAGFGLLARRRKRNGSR
jgi:fibronectin-binding autotransporter adhesin